MVRLAMMMCVVAIKCVYGRRPLPPLPMKGGCYHVFSELDVYKVEDEAVILAFPIFESVLEVRNIAPPTASYIITKANGTEAASHQAEGRVQQHNRQLWFLPVQVSDAGEYICTYRNETYCVTGSITLHVYKSSSVDVDMVSYSISATVGENLTCECPSLHNFNRTLIKWHKTSSPTALHRARKGSFHQDQGNLKIPAVKRSHAGVYTCQLSVLINNQQYKVSRLIKLDVEGSNPEMTTAPDRVPTSSYSTVHLNQPPVILSPLNGSIFESPHGSGLELFCTVLTECEKSESTIVTWMVNGRSAQLYRDGRILQRERKITKLAAGCMIDVGLAIVAMTEDDVKAELKCITQNQGGRREAVVQLQLEDATFTWLVVAAVAVSCLLTVVSVFLYALFKPKRKKKMDYILARQNSIF
ncbi:interleukin-1 receptor type 2 [Betta splendens]|uniref:Interleukin-1 receptor type 2 n=1 Tax=Betta splendens TaxID=158456 RepID=A0A6P7LFW1_BETSP|nr:interleukin-1 receptor type 2 [Betta splendens]XP_028993182.1 interleukin-1 receptor type 2 [Betta splendens]